LYQISITFAEEFCWNGSWNALLGIQAALAVTVAFVIAFRGVHIFRWCIPNRISSQRAIVIYTPSQNLAIMSQSYAVHSAYSHLDDSHDIDIKKIIETRALDIRRFLATPSNVTESELATLAGAKDIDI
jgi:hypothetical protein